MAQLVERHLAKVDVAGSSPVARSIFAGIAQQAEHRADNAGVTGSNPVVRTIINKKISKKDN